MNRLLIMGPVAMLFAACGSDSTDGVTDSPESAGGAADAELVLGETRLVENPPTYPSDPLPEGLE